MKKSSIFNQGLGIKHLYSDCHILQKHLETGLKTGFVKEVMLEV